MNLYIVHNEVEPSYAYHNEAVTTQFPDATDIAYVNGERVPVDNADGVVLTGSTAAVYDDRPWIADQQTLVRSLVEQHVPTLGICFGHQLANVALGGQVERIGATMTLVTATLADDPLFADISPTVVSLHEDGVTALGEEMSVIATADHAPIFGTKHRTAPLWTVQFHPELTAMHRDRLIADFDWAPGQHSFADVNAQGLFGNFRELVTRHHTTE